MYDLQLLSFDRSPIVQDFGIQLISSDPLSIPARVLATPPLNYGGDSRSKSVVRPDASKRDSLKEIRSGQLMEVGICELISSGRSLFIELG